MAIYERYESERTPEEVSVERIRTRLRQAVTAMRQAVRDVNREVGEHGRQALASVVQSQGDDPNELKAAYDAVKDALAAVTGQQQPELP